MERTNTPGPGQGEAPGEGPLDRPERDAGDPIGDDAYPGGQLMPPTADMDDPIPETGMPGEPELESGQLDREEELDRHPG
jgi:hypothetical protein